MMFLARLEKLLGLVGQGLGAAGQARVGLHGQATVASLVLLEDGLEQLGRLDAHLTHDLPAISDSVASGISSASSAMRGSHTSLRWLMQV